MRVHGARACGSAVSHDVQDTARVEPREQLTQRGLQVAGRRDQRLVVPGHVADGEQVGALLRLVRVRGEVRVRVRLELGLDAGSG